MSLRDLPSIDRLLHSSQGADMIRHFGRTLTLDALRTQLDDARAAIRSGGTPPDDAALLRKAQAALEDWRTPTLQPVINATGVVIHTNLGRAPLSHAAREAMEAVAAGYSTLEYDLESGTRGKREVHAEHLLRQLTGAEAALVVNNNASAVMLSLTALAKGREVLISRSQLIEIGGGFRIPDVMAQSGARVVEIGTTNRTHLHDYEEAVGDHTALILRAHHSNFKIVGFTKEPSLVELVELGRRHRLPVLDDLGSGALLDTADFGLGHEPMVQESLQADAAIVAFSGDKLLGGPQAGLLLGKAEWIDRLRKHPMARAVRPDKLCLAALSATLMHYLKEEAVTEIPVWQMIATPADQLQARAANWQDHLGTGEVAEGLSTVGGGSLPEESLPTWLLRIEHPSPDELAARLRAASPPLIGRIQEGALLLDPRTVLPDQEADLLSILRESLAQVVA